MVVYYFVDVASGVVNLEFVLDGHFFSLVQKLFAGAKLIRANTIHKEDHVDLDHRQNLNFVNTLAIMVLRLDLFVLKESLDTL